MIELRFYLVKEQNNKRLLYSYVKINYRNYSLNVGQSQDDYIKTGTLKNNSDKSRKKSKYQRQE